VVVDVDVDVDKDDEAKGELVIRVVGKEALSGVLRGEGDET